MQCNEQASSPLGALILLDSAVSGLPTRKLDMEIAREAAALKCYIPGKSIYTSGSMSIALSIILRMHASPADV